MGDNSILYFGGFVILLIVLVGGGVGLASLISDHMEFKRKLALAQLENSKSDLAKKIAALSKELAELRESTTQYDLSFDTAVQRLESRVSHLENQLVEATEILSSRS